jgi:hypothetical protein
MSATKMQLLLGAAAVTAGVVVWGRASGRSSAASGLTSVDSKQTMEGGEPSANVMPTAPAIAGEVLNGTMGQATIGGDPVAGTGAGCQTTPIEYSGPCGEPGASIQVTESPGGADPSTANNAGAAAQVAEAGIAAGANNGFWAGGTIKADDMAYITQWGDTGASGTTKRQQADAYALQGAQTGEVW